VNEEDVNRSAQRDRDGSTILIATLVAAIAGFATIYLSLAPSDNGRIASSGGEAPKNEASRPASATAQGPLAGLNKGAMAAFVIKGTPTEVPAMAFVDASGAQKSLSDWRGKVVLLNIWATWCVPCREEMPMLDKLQAELGGKDFDVVAVNIDRGGAEKPAKFLVGTNASHIALYTDPSGKLFSVVKAVGMPTTLLIGRDGKELGRLVGPADWGSPEAVRLIKAAIAAPT
jgi:thiol-disulfide isomerase/thioredoxin